MPAGLTIYNDSGTVQVDESYRNVALKEKRAVALSHSIGAVYTNIVVTGVNALVAMQSANYAPFLVETTFDGVDWTYRWGFQYLGAGAPTSDTAYAYIFDVVDPNPDNFGMEVYDASGNLVFHSSAKCLKIVAVAGHSSGYTGTSGRVYVPLILTASIRSILFGMTFLYETTALLASGNVITPIDFAMASGVAGVSGVGTFAAIDVTGY